MADRLTQVNKVLLDNDISVTFDYDFNKLPQILTPSVDDELINKLYDLYVNNIIDDAYSNPEYGYHCGQYFHHMKDDYENSIKYFKKGIKMGNVSSMMGKACLYYDNSEYNEFVTYVKRLIKKDIVPAYDLLIMYYYKYHEADDLEKQLIKYCRLAIKKDSVLAMVIFGKYYLDIFNYVFMKKYLNMAIDRKCGEAMYIMSGYYRNQSDTENEIKYLKMGVKEKHVRSITILAGHYQYSGEIDNMIKYLQKAIKLGDVNSMVLLGDHYKYKDFAKMKEYYTLAINNNYMWKNALVKEIEKQEAKISLKVQHTINKKRYREENTDCPICYEKRELYPYDCFNHSICESCYDMTKECPFCKMPKHPLLS